MFNCFLSPVNHFTIPNVLFPTFLHVPKGLHESSFEVTLKDSDNIYVLIDRSIKLQRPLSYTRHTGILPPPPNTHCIFLLFLFSFLFRLSVFHFVRPSVRPSVRLSVCLFVCLIVRPSVWSSVRLWSAVRLSVWSSVRLSCLAVSICLQLFPNRPSDMIRVNAS